MAACALLVAAGCTKHDAVDLLIARAHRPDRIEGGAVGPYALLSGDVHVHVTPPDRRGHVARELPATVEIAREEGLDFVVLMPHLWSGFYEDPERRAIAHSELDMLERAAARIDDVVVSVGFEYSGRGGHAGAAFADLGAVLEAVPASRAERDPGAFFREWVEQGGLLVINHPYLTPLDAPIENASWDLSWKRWTAGARPPAEYVAIERLALGVETYNLAVDHLRDKYLLRAPRTSMRAAMYQLERQIRRQRRRMVPVGGSDSHSHHLRATTFVLARERSERGIAEAFRAGRLCVRGPAACSLQARVPGGPWRPIGASLEASDEVEVRARGERIAVLRDGRVVARPRSGMIAAIPVARDSCTLLRARVDGGESAHVYVGCPFAGEADDEGSP